MWRSLFLAVAATAALSGCYSDHFQQTDILVSTMPPGADCTLTRGPEKVGEINPTPGIAMVSRDAGDIAIACRRPGFADAAAVSHSLGNAVDMSVLTEGRAGYSYQTPIDIQLQPTR
jgi:hypothetical protein